jgi:predicted nucleic acid-binding protein
VICLVADSGPLIALAKLGHLDLPARLYGRAVLPRTVFTECVTEAYRPDAEAIQQAVNARWLEVVEDVAWPEQVSKPRLDPGESAALAMALGSGSSLLIDEQRGRKAARRLGVRVVGVLGLLLLAKQGGHLDAVAPALARLNAERYFISPALCADVLDMAGETP